MIFPIEINCTGNRTAFDAEQVGAAAGAHLDHPLRHERTHRLPDDGAGDAELLAQLAFRGETIAGPKAAREDRLEHHRRDLVGEPRLALD